jgi:predicted nucleotide-binding protein
MNSYFQYILIHSINVFIESLIVDITNNEYDFTPVSERLEPPEIEIVDAIPKDKTNKVFIVHGHDGHVKERTARFIEKLGFEAIILHEQVNKSRTIIEKIEDYSDVTDFAIVLYTPDDLGVVKTNANSLQPRARQNVIFEHGFLMGKLGRENVVPLVEGDIELPNDISGIVYVSENWEMKIAQEMQEAGYDIDFNKLLKK